ncbi:DUF642 domain-containing protein [Cohnella soli]|uniref:DUF642 domain-containing protein n=1 Tax=Cohnella soli TaxID=425005 RepID=A0ABW0HP18_9BACL
MSAKKMLLVVFAVVLLVSFPMNVLAQDRAFDRYKHYVSLTNNGLGFSDSEDASTLGWAESPYLDSYIDIYNRYRDTYWLDKFVEHFDKVKANAIDPEADGSYGWYTPVYSYQHMWNNNFELDSPDAAAAEGLGNGGFETAGTDGVPGSWTREAGSNTTAFRTTTAGEYYSGSAGLAIKYNSGNAATLKQSFSYSPGRKYALSFMAKTDSMTTTARVQIYNETTSTVIAETANYGSDSLIKDDWVQSGFTFTAPTTAGQTLVVKIKLAKLDQNGWAAYFDDFSIKPVGSVINAMQNGDFETPDSGDGTLPSKWSRLGTSAYTYLSTASGEHDSGSAGLVVKSDGTSWKEVYQRLPYTPGATYTLTFSGKTNSSAAYGRLLVYNATDSQYVLDQTFNNTAWQKHAYTFTAPSTTGKEVYVYLRQSNYTNPSWIAYFDHLEIEPYVENVNENSAFFSVDSGDGTLPAGWERYQSTSSNAYVSDKLNEYYSPFNGVVIESNHMQVPMMRKKLYLIPGMRYNVTFLGRNNNPSAQGKVDIYNSTTSSTLGSTTFSDATWAANSFTFTAPSSITDTVYLRLLQGTTAVDGSLISYFDDVQVVPAVKRSFAGWTRVNKTVDTAYTSNEAGNSASGYGLVIGNDGSTDGYVVQRLRGYEANKPYSVYFSGKTSSSANGGKVVVYDVTAASELASMTFENTEWSGQQLNFTTPGTTSHVVEIRLMQQYANNSSQYAFFDRVSVGEQSTWLVHETMLAKPALKFIKTVYENSELSTAYESKADEYLAFIEEKILPKWDAYYKDLGNNRGVYIFPAGNRAAYFPGRTLPHNQYLVASECYLLLGDITANSDYAVRATALLNNFKDHLQVNQAASTAYKWNYWDSAGPWDNGMTYVGYEEDSSHANLDVSAAITAYHYGVVFNEADMKKFASTFVNAMWNGSSIHPVIGPNVIYNGERTEWLLAYNTDLWAWLKLAEFDPQIWSIANGVLQTVVDENWLESFAWTLTYMANLAICNPETLVNGNFEWADKDDPTLPAYWQRYLSNTTSSTAYRDTSNAYRGHAGLANKTNGSSWNIVQQQITGYLPNSSYELKVTGKVGTSSVLGRADVFNYTTSNAIGSVFIDDTAWETGSLVFTTPNNTTDTLKVDLYHNLYSPANYYSYFDNVSIYASLWNSFAPNGGFEEKNKYDVTLPKYWERATGTLPAKALIDTAEKYKGTNSLKLITDVSAGSQKLQYTLQGFKPSANYTVKFYAKTNGSTAKAKVSVSNVTEAVSLGTSPVIDSTSWGQYTFSFTAPADATAEVRIYLEHNDPNVSGGIAYFDEFGVTLD